MSAAVATRSLERPGTCWVNSPGWDAVWMFSALWGVPLLLVGSLVTNLAAFALALFALNQLMAVFHSLSTTYIIILKSIGASFAPASYPPCPSHESLISRAVRVGCDSRIRETVRIKQVERRRSLHSAPGAVRASLPVFYVAFLPGSTASSPSRHFF